jgi:site-specific DNA recombinase
VRVGTYARISDDADQTGLGVARQQDDTRQLVDQRGWTLVESYTDNDVSAYQPKAKRPDFERMLGDLEAGTLQGIVVYDLDRLARKPSDLERIIDLYDQRPLVFATVQQDIDLSTPDGRTMARVMVAFANKSSMDTARRMARKKQELAENGLGFSNYRPFGWNEDRLTLNEPEAQLLRDAAEDVLRGTALSVICDRWNSHGWRTVRGNRWGTNIIRRVLRAPRIAGFAMYQGELLTDSGGQPIRGKWEPILDEATWRALCEALVPKQRAQRKPGRMLTNVARCGVCGAGMAISRYANTYRYLCRGDIITRGCNRIGIDGPKLEAQIESLIFAYLDQKIETPPVPWQGQARLDEVNTKIAELMEEYRAGLSGQIVFPMVRTLEAEQSELRAEQVQFTRRKHRKSITIEGEWSDLDLHAKRAVIQSVIEAVVIKPIGSRINHYDPSRVDVIPLAY